jgi:hypothetical protein
MRIDDLEQRVEAVEEQNIHGAINLNVTGSLLVALIRRMVGEGMVSTEFANTIF